MIPAGLHASTSVSIDFPDSAVDDWRLYGGCDCWKLDPPALIQIRAQSGFFLGGDVKQGLGIQWSCNPLNSKWSVNSSGTGSEVMRRIAAPMIGGMLSAVGHCGDNAACEGFFGVIKRDRINRKRYPTRETARADVFNYIEMFHNPRMRQRVAKRDWQYSVYSEPSEKTG